MEQLNDTLVIVIRYLHAKIHLQLFRILVKALIIKNNCIYFVFCNIEVHHRKIGFGPIL